MCMKFKKRRQKVYQWMYMCGWYMNEAGTHSIVSYHISKRYGCGGVVDIQVMSKYYHECSVRKKL
jgi:hypothetical protein